MVGAPNFLSRTTLRPRGPRVTLTASASALTPCSRRCRASSEKLRIFAMSFLIPSHATAPARRAGTGAIAGCQKDLLFDHGEYIASGEHQVLLAGVLHLSAAVLRVDDRVTHLDVERDPLAVLVEAPWAYRL